MNIIIDDTWKKMACQPIQPRKFGFGDFGKFLRGVD